MNTGFATQTDSSHAHPLGQSYILSQYSSLSGALDPNSVLQIPRDGNVYKPPCQELPSSIDICNIEPEESGIQYAAHCDARLYAPSDVEDESVSENPISTATYSAIWEGDVPDESDPYLNCVSAAAANETSIDASQFDIMAQWSNQATGGFYIDCSLSDASEPILYPGPSENEYRQTHSITTHDANSINQCDSLHATADYMMSSNNVFNSGTPIADVANPCATFGGSFLDFPVDAQLHPGIGLDEGQNGASLTGLQPAHLLSHNEYVEQPDQTKTQETYSETFHSEADNDMDYGDHSNLQVGQLINNGSCVDDEMEGIFLIMDTLIRFVERRYRNV
ncbi:hypothetical protein D9619_012393 [Psilocybe cf. subviscida]|uniref:Uncharacterized protein n=1 Tax=Psilocybe cf. subviscida TaxID=2480587 RepID=A0A8H5ARQ8_9AGAR|nr:hypothetical protein D9619_012393 [Psilocybe cf. subviscida]